ncbi:hypothetical protein ASPZODRAFT_68501 [Penicilliopsis zonata CBS 506.65]|uniref:Aminotransferase class I/classII large domain-containing protein n=1 Tax=Penicilliopsis zonata CBS 506.65 TaxID=1073090 RepID=A0A1L9SFQ3_9EURO|nr:hypothetical protein ASPZODRAFT_68501 [Penicilliopsis zonata CBS 506.65]OJJ45948.1 hypothetical protein ASPZODRAFT_68501 [Penicilliopsis zonata CBS 506.65]
MLSTRATENMTWFKSQFARQIGHASSTTLPAIDMTIAENWLVRGEMIAAAKDAVARELSAEHLSYSSGLGGSAPVLEAAAGFFNRFFAPRVPVLPDHIVTGAGCSGILDSLLYSLCGEGEGVLVEAPFWGSFSAYGVLRNNVHLVPVYTSSDNMIEAYQNALRSSPYPIKAALFCNPQNPRGQLYPAEEIKALLHFCKTEKLHLISDEIYALSQFEFGDHDSQRNTMLVEPPTFSFVSVLSIDVEEADRARIHVITSVSKDLGSSGLRMGFLVTQANAALRFAMSIYNNAKVSNMTALVVARLFSDNDTLDCILRQSRESLRAAADLVVAFMLKHHIPCYRPIAGVYIWARLGGNTATRESETALQQRLVDAGVRVGPGWEYAEREAGWFRVSFALPRAQLLEGLKRMEGLLDYSI